MSGVIPSERAWKRTAAAVRAVEALGLGGKTPHIRQPLAAFAAIGAEVSPGLYEAEEKILDANRAFVAMPAPRIWDADKPLLVLGIPPEPGQHLQILSLTTPDGPICAAYNPHPARITRRITGNTDFGETLWDGLSTVGTDEMWEEYSELNLTTGRYDKLARKLYGACP